MCLRHPALLPLLIGWALCTGCLRSYNASPLSPVPLSSPAQLSPGLEVKTHAFLKVAEIEEKFGKRLARDTQVLAVQFSLASKATTPYKVLRSRIKLKGPNDARVSALSTEGAIQQGREPWEYAILFGVFGIPSAVTGYQANEKLEADYQAKLLRDEILEPGKELQGVLFFDPCTQGLKRADTFSLLLELEDAGTGSKQTLETALN